MKKLLLTLGAVASVAAPVAAVVACSSDSNEKTLASTKTEDQLTALNAATYADVAALDAAFGITTNAGDGNVTKVVYNNGKLSFTTSVAGDEKDFAFTITPKTVPAAAGTSKEYASQFGTYTFKSTADAADITALLKLIGYTGTINPSVDAKASGNIYIPLNGATATIFQGNKEGNTIYPKLAPTHGKDDFVIIIKKDVAKPAVAYDKTTQWPLENVASKDFNVEDPTHDSAENFGDLKGEDVSKAIDDANAFAAIYVQTDTTGKTVVQYLDLKTVLSTTETTGPKVGDTVRPIDSDIASQMTVHKIS